uniref:Plastocyanin-like domain-containing protein n=1 Tax=Salix viminalis TaxID=40686 RepID=A0A6N2KT50_SALVM
MSLGDSHSSPTLDSVILLDCRYYNLGHYLLFFAKTESFIHIEWKVTVCAQQATSDAVHEGDNVEIKVKNQIAQNIPSLAETRIISMATGIFRSFGNLHGIRQLRTGWADGPAYVTQCPIRGGKSYTTSSLSLTERDTAMHAHYAWQRASVYGEWWNGDPDEVEKRMMLTGAGPDNSGIWQTTCLGSSCSSSRRLFFAVAKHTLTVVEQTSSDFTGMFVMAARPYLTSVFPSTLTTSASSVPCNVPQTIDKRVITTISLNLQDCQKTKLLGLQGKSFFASMNNQSFNMNTEFGTKLIVVPYGTNVEIVLQDTSFLNLENHPIHVHGHNFFIVGSGLGNFNEQDPKDQSCRSPEERLRDGLQLGSRQIIQEFGSYIATSSSILHGV